MKKRSISVLLCIVLLLAPLTMGTSAEQGTATGITGEAGILTVDRDELKRGEDFTVSFAASSSVDAVKMWSLDASQDDPVFSKSVKSSDVVTISTIDFVDGDYTIGAFNKGELVDAVDVYIDYIDYKNDGSYIYIFDDTYVLDLSNQEHDDVEGKLFVGWYKSDGVAAVSGTFDAGTVLEAKYVDLDTADNGDYFIVGVQMKGTGAQQIRYIFEQSDKFVSALNTVIQYGAIVINPDILCDNKWAELEYGKVYTYNGEEYTPNVITGNIVSGGASGKTRYEVTFDVAEDDYETNYIARGFIRFYDANGIERIVLTEPYQTSVFNIANHTLNNSRGGINAATRTNLEKIVSSARNAKKSKYDAEEKITVVGSPENEGTYIYKLADSGIMIREMTVDSGLGGDPIEIVQMSDTHINYMNALDFAEANPTLLSTYETRSWLKDASSVPTIRKVLDYASRADQIVISGDVIDYLSRGAIEVMWKEIWNYYPSALLTNGNHDTYQRLGSVGDIYDFNYRYNWISGAWKHDFDYTSTVVKNKAMVIQLNNGQSRFEASQVEPLKNDLELARQKGYPVFIFCHIPIYTNNPAETEVNWLRYDDWTSVKHDFYTNKDGVFVGKPSDKGTGSATDLVYSLITNNGDIIKGVFNGHLHNDYYSEIVAKTATGESTVIPQYTMTGSIYGDGHAVKITVK